MSKQPTSVLLLPAHLQHGFLGWCFGAIVRSRPLQATGSAAHVVPPSSQRKRKTSSLAKADFFRYNTHSYGEVPKWLKGTVC
jgi:chemotaxis receptor (MCP) glutamine deamidase CheD